MPWTIQTALPTWNVTDVALMKRLQYLLLEAPNNADATGTSTLTDMFTTQEWLDVLNQRQEKFIRDTACIFIRATQASTPGIARYALPPDWIHTRRLSWQPFGSQIKALARTDAYQLDHAMLDWQQNFDIPTTYNDGSDLPTLTVEIAKAPSGIGSMILGYVSQPQTLTGAGVLLNIPDEFADGPVLWGALADLLGSDGPANDPERAQFCETMYQLGVEMARMMMEGSEAGSANGQ